MRCAVAARTNVGHGGVALLAVLGRGHGRYIAPGLSRPTVEYEIRTLQEKLGLRGVQTTVIQTSPSSPVENGAFRVLSVRLDLSICH